MSQGKKSPGGRSAADTAEQTGFAPERRQLAHTAACEASQVLDAISGSFGAHGFQPELWRGNCARLDTLLSVCIEATGGAPGRSLEDLQTEVFGSGSGRLSMGSAKGTRAGNPAEFQDRFSWWAGSLLEEIANHALSVRKLLDAFAACGEDSDAGHMDPVATAKCAAHLSGMMGALADAGLQRLGFGQVAGDMHAWLLSPCLMEAMANQKQGGAA